MSSGPKNVTSTTNTEPPSYLVPSLQQAAAAAGQEFNYLNQGGRQVVDPQTNPNIINPGNLPGNIGGGFYGGGRLLEDGPRQPAGGALRNPLGEPPRPYTTQVPGVPAERTGAGLDALFQRGAEGSPLVDQAGGLTSRTLAGDFLSPDTNPFLEQTFNRAADLTRTRLDTEFAGSGRNLGAARPARSDELQTLAANIYGQNFQQERDRQQQAVDQAESLAGVDFKDIQAMIDSGTFPLDQFINRLAGIIPGAGGVTSATQPFFRTGLF